MIDEALIKFAEKIECSDQYLVDISRDPIFPMPWHRDRVLSACVNIGDKKPWGAWKQDNSNHSIELWLPWRIVFVHGGNHSISAGIFSGSGIIMPSVVKDFSKCFSSISCDGRHFFGANGKKIAKVTDHRKAAVFEIGRLIANPVRRIP